MVNALLNFQLFFYVAILMYFPVYYFCENGTKVPKMFQSETSATYTRHNLKSKSIASRDVKLYPVERSSKLTSKISVCMRVIEMYKLYMDFSTASLITLSLSMPSSFVCVWGGGRRVLQNDGNTL